MEKGVGNPYQTFSSSLSSFKPPGMCSAAISLRERMTYMANMRALMNKLQTALCMKGKIVKITQYHNWNEEKRRAVTKYVICKKDNNSDKYISFFESYQLSEVVKALAGMLDGGGR
jgi:hypothetical protein